LQQEEVGGLIVVIIFPLTSSGRALCPDDTILEEDIFFNTPIKGKKGKGYRDNDILNVMEHAKARGSLFSSRTKQQPLKARFRRRETWWQSN